MIVSITGLPLNTGDQFAIDNLKMWAGKKGDIVDLRGNSNHPNAAILDTTNKGFSWAFVASADGKKDKAVAELGLPGNEANITTRVEILDNNSVRNVLEKMVKSWVDKENDGDPINWDNPTTAEDNFAISMLNSYLKQANPPAYFNSDGFVQAETAPDNDYTSVEANLEALTPFNPNEVNTLNILFQ